MSATALLRSHAALHRSRSDPTGAGLVPFDDRSPTARADDPRPDSIVARSARTVPELSVVVPARDERGNIAPLVAEIRAALDGVFRHEIVHVDDGSTDGTLDELRRVRSGRTTMPRIVRQSKASE